MNRILRGDVRSFSRHYRGEKFHALLCDPPYELSFMSKKWDGTGVAFDPATWEALAEHLHPGGFGMAFASSRGWHRLACAIEDAGLRIHPSIFGWVFGCLSEDTEILTVDGWKLHHELLPGSMVMGYNVEQDSIEPMPALEVYRYDYSDTAYRIRSDHTDQVVSRNHRCLVWRDGRWRFEMAECLGPQERVPYCEPQETRIRPTTQAQRESNHLSGVWEEGLQACGVAEEDAVRRRILFKELSGQSECRTPSSILREWGRKEESEKGNEGCEESCMERRCDLLPQARGLRTNQVCSMSSRVPGDGPQGRLRDGASTDRCSMPGTTAVAIRDSASRGSRPYGQPHRELNAVLKQFSPQEIRTSWRTATTLARVEPIHYEGTVWCVRVRTSAFVARRNGHIFLTGNSGFPKATRIDTQIDKAAGAEREVIGKIERGSVQAAKERGSGYLADPANRNNVKQFGYGTESITAPATSLAKAWEGHRYGLQAMKPALEPIIVFQKPYSGKPVESIVETGAGALWIDGARIGTASGLQRPARQGKGVSGGWAGYTQEPGQYGTNDGQGRWPSNFYLGDDEAAARLGEQSGVDKRVFLQHNGSTEVMHTCCAHASIADLNLMLDRLMLKEGLADSVVGNVGTPAGANEGKLMRGGNKTSDVEDGTEYGESQGVGSSTGSLKTDGSGRCQTDQSQTDTTSTTLTEIKRTTSCPICESCLHLNITLCTNDGGKTTESNPTELKRDAASDAGDINHLDNSVSVQRGHITATAKIVKESINGNGARKTRHTTRNTSASGASNGPSRFFFNVNRQIDEADPVLYKAKASRKERDAGLDGVGEETVVFSNGRAGRCPIHGKTNPSGQNTYSCGCPIQYSKDRKAVGKSRNSHPTVKPIDLTRWLSRLLLPPDAYAPRRILIPFSGSGSECIGAMLAGWEEVVGIEMDLEYVRIARARLAYWAARPEQLGFDL